MRSITPKSITSQHFPDYRVWQSAGRTSEVEVEEMNRVIKVFQHTAICLALLALIAGMGISGARAEIFLDEEFDGDTLDPAWEITFEEATGWTYEVANNWLTVTDVGFDTYHGEWSRVCLSREFVWVDDFELGCPIGWDSEETARAMQTFTIILRDKNDVVVASASYHDAWDQSRGHISARAGDEMYYPPPNMLPHSGEGTFTFRRIDGVVTIDWNDSQILTGVAADPVNRVELWFMSGAWPTAVFGSLSVNAVLFEAQIWPTSAELASWGGVKVQYR